MAAKDKPLAFYLQIEDRYGTKRMVAHPAIVQPDGTFHNPSWVYGDTYAESLDGFSIHARLDRSDTHAWGVDHSFEPHILKLEQAEAIVRVLRKIRKGLEQANSEQGYADGFAAYVFRIAAILGVRTYYTRNTDKGRDMSGEDFRQTDGAGVQYWIRARENELCKKVNADA